MIRILYIPATAAAAALAGSAGLTLGSSGNLAGAAGLAGDATLTLAAAGSLVGAAGMAGSTTLALTNSGALAGAAAMAGAATLDLAAAGDLTLSGGPTPAPGRPLGPGGWIFEDDPQRRQEAERDRWRDRAELRRMIEEAVTGIETVETITPAVAAAEAIIDRYRRPDESVNYAAIALQVDAARQILDVWREIERIRAEWEQDEEEAEMLLLQA